MTSAGFTSLMGHAEDYSVLKLAMHSGHKCDIENDRANFTAVLEYCACIKTFLSISCFFKNFSRFKICGIVGTRNTVVL